MCVFVCLFVSQPLSASLNLFQPLVSPLVVRTHHPLIKLSLIPLHVLLDIFERLLRFEDAVLVIVHAFCDGFDFLVDAGHFFLQLPLCLLAC